MKRNERPAKRFLLGLTGGMASGKSTVGRWLGEAGFLVVDADRVVAQLYAPGGEGASAVRELFGASALTPEGAVDRARVAERVFADPETRDRLEAVIHPMVRRRFRQLAAKAEGVVVYEATLLVEFGHSEVFDLVLSVEAPDEERLRRAIARGMDEASARARLEAQGDGVRRRAGADRILANDGTLADLREVVGELVRELEQRVA